MIIQLHDKKKNFFMKRVYLSLGRGTEVFCVCVIKKEKFTQSELYMHMTFFKLKNTTERYCTLFSFEVGMINLKCFYKIIRRAVLFLLINMINTLV